jgi:hypothetical protein
MQALTHLPKVERGKVLGILPMFLRALSPPICRAAVAALVRNDVVELLVGHIVEAGLAEDGTSSYLLLLFLDHPKGLERGSAKGVVNQLVKAVPQWLMEVRDTTATLWHL